jgi:hypothetical protein
MIALALSLLQDAATLKGSQPQAAVAPDGTVHVVLIQDRNIAVVSSKDGRSFGAPAIAIDSGGRARGGMRRGPRIGVDSKGNLTVTAFLCFDPEEMKRQYPASELWLARSEDGGKSWSSPVHVNDAPKKASEALHWMAVSPEGDVHLAWLDHRNGKQNELWYAAVTGARPSKNRRIYGEVCECCAPGLAVDAGGNPIVVVRDRSEANRAVLMLQSKDKGNSFGAPLTLNASPTGIGT